MAKQLNGSKTHQNLKDAFAGESQANRRYLYFAKVADVEGLPEIAGNFKETADGETGHAHGHLEYLESVGDPATGLPIGNTEKNLKAAIAGETHEYETMYPGMAKSAREEGFDDIAEWFETLAKAEKSHAGRFQKMLDTLEVIDRAAERDGTRLATRASPRRSASTSRRRATPWPRSIRSPNAAARVRLQRRALLGRARPRGRAQARLRDLPLVPDVRELLRQLPGPVRARRSRHRDERARTAPSCSTRRTSRRVTDLCWQCKLCYIKCPYTPDQGHAWMVDFPRLLQREKAQRAKRNGITMQDRALGEPGRLGALMAGRVRAGGEPREREPPPAQGEREGARHLERVPVPPFAPQTFESWLAKHEPLEAAGKAGTVAIFATCLGDYNFPKLAAATRARPREERLRGRAPAPGVLRHAEPRRRRHRRRAREGRFNVAQLFPLVREGLARSSCPGPTCSYTIKKEWPELLGTPEAQGGRREHVRGHGVPRAPPPREEAREGLHEGLGKVAYHAACHLRAQKIGTPGARILGARSPTPRSTSSRSARPSTARGE